MIHTQRQLCRRFYWDDYCHPDATDFDLSFTQKGGRLARLATPTGRQKMT